MHGSESDVDPVLDQLLYRRIVRMDQLTGAQIGPLGALWEPFRRRLVSNAAYDTMLKQYNLTGPYINLVGVEFSALILRSGVLAQLWCCVLGSTNESKQRLKTSYRVEIGYRNLEGSFTPDQDVFGLQVAVSKSFLVQIRDSL